MPTTFKDLIALSVEELGFKTRAHVSMWGFGSEETWQFDADKRTIAWFFRENKIATARGEIIGTFNAVDETWLWAWANRSILDAPQSCANFARVFGLQHDFDRLIEPKFNCNLEEAWELAAIAMHIAKKQGIYKSTEADLHVFICFWDVSIDAES